MATTSDSPATGQATDELAAQLRDSGLVDVKWYLRTYADVALANLDPALHYVEHGVGEGRNPNSHFNTNWYLDRYPDVKQSGLNPLYHYLVNGAREGRATSPIFDTAYYVAENPDIALSGINPLVHHIRHGFREGRRGWQSRLGGGNRG